MLLTALALQPDALATIPIAISDGSTVAHDGPLRFGIVGGYQLAPPSLDHDLREAGLDLVVLAGDAVERGSARAYRDLAARLSGIPLSPMPGRGERRGDRRLRRFMRTWDGLEQRGLTEEASWRAFDLVARGQPWRVVLLDADREALSQQLWDERFWLPKVISEGEAPLIVLLNEPLSDLSAGDVPSPGARELHEAIGRYAPGSRVALVASTSGTPAFSLPGGVWGEAWLQIGRVGGAPATLRRTAGALSLAESFDLALVTWLSERSEEAALLDAGLDYDARRWPLFGWWRVEIDADVLSLTLRLTRNDIWQDVFTARWTRDGGWESP